MLCFAGVDWPLLDGWPRTRSVLVAPPKDVRKVLSVSTGDVAAAAA
ncbi:hypothetical protein [Tessaracoccus sp. OH4464_COT-324]|nr:hypothetical protein [Tessaracoccus sp. OH4464_COT-324]